MAISYGRGLSFLVRLMKRLHDYIPQHELPPNLNPQALSPAKAGTQLSTSHAPQSPGPMPSSLNEALGALRVL